MIHYLGKKVGGVVPKKTVAKRNEDKSWEYGYDPDYDIVIISKDGTIGEIYEINSVKIAFPSIPDKQEIINHDKPIKEQKWKRESMPLGLNEETQFNPQYEDYIVEEFRRRTQGVWVLIKGKKIFLPGTSYFFLQWTKLDEGYPEFRVIQNELLIYWEACKADQRSYGICYVKNRRFGWSSICNTEQIDAGTLAEEKELGIVSKTREDGKKMFSKLVRSFKKLPPFFMPLVDGNTTPKQELILSEPSTKRSKGKKISAGEGLDTIFRFHSTVLNAMDGDKVYRSSLDEAGKFPKECPFDQYWRIVKTSHRQGKRIVGKAMVGSTVNAMSKGGREFKNIYDQSDPESRNQNGQTASGLYKLFISAEFCLEGFFDEYGFSIVDDPKVPVRTDLGELTSIGANTFLDNELEALKEDPEAFNEQLRQFPRSERDAFRDEATDCEFNLVKIQEQLDHNEFDLDESIIQRGNFTWEGGVPDTRVVWRPNKDGRFLITHHPPEEFKNAREQKTFGGVTGWAPKASHVGCFGVDPYNRSKTSDGRGSQGSMHMSTKYNTSDLPNNAFILEYIDRPSKVEHFFEDVIMAIVYYSMPILPELSNEAFLTTLKNRGYRHYVLNNPFKHYTKLNPTERELGGAPPQDQKIGDQQFYAIESYIEDYIGYARENRNRPVGEIGFMPFSRTLTQWKDVDLKKRTDYDAYISSSLSLLGNQKRTNKVETKKTIRNFFTKYKNNGLKSTAA